MKFSADKLTYLVLAASACIVASAWPYNIATDSVQYVMSDAHLDTQWNWDFGKTRSEYIPGTFNLQLALMNANPNYVFSFESAWHYMMEKTDHPTVYAQVKAMVASGQWTVAGSMLVAPDVTVSSPESVIRQVLYGNGFFKSEFGKRSVDLFLPDCFGWGKALPTIANHVGLVGMCTAKWYNFSPPQCVDLPADIFRWYGVDGSYIIAAMHPGAYDNTWENNFSLARIDTLGSQTGGKVKASYILFGIGDTGGARSDGDYARLQSRIDSNATKGIKFVNTSTDQMYKDLNAANLTRYLPSYTGEMLMRYHGNALYTNYSDIKQKNRRNELQAAAAEAAATVASISASQSYPTTVLANAWIQFLWHQMHDDLPGSCIQSAYDTYTIPDENAAYAAFSATLQQSDSCIASRLATSVSSGVPIVVFNPLSMARTDAVDAVVYLPGRGANKFVKVLDTTGAEVPSQVDAWSGDTATCVFIAAASPLGYAVYTVAANASYTGPASELSATTTAMSNSQFTMAVGGAGALNQYHDIAANKDLLIDGARLHLFATANSTNPKAIDFATMSETPVVVSDNPVVTVQESGPARVGITVVAGSSGSTFTRTYRMTPAACGNVLEVVFSAAWNSDNLLLKATFPFNIINDSAQYDCGIGTVARGTNTSRQYEVVAQNWASISDNKYTGAVLTYAKYGWDKPDNHTLRLSLIHSNPSMAMDKTKPQACRYGLVGKSGAFSAGPIAAAAAKFNQPLIAFQTTPHAGPLGKGFSFLSINSPQVMVMALKKAETSGATIVRVRELTGAPAQNVRMTFANPIATATEVNGQEDDLGPAGVSISGAVAQFSLTGFQPKAFAFTFGASTGTIGGRTGGLAVRSASSPDRIFDLFDMSGKRIGKAMARELAKVNVVARKLTLGPGVIIAESRDGVERRTLRIEQ